MERLRFFSQCVYFPFMHQETWNSEIKGNGCWRCPQSSYVNEEYLFHLHGVQDVYLFPRLKSLVWSVLALVIHTESVNIRKKELFTTNKSSFPPSMHSFLIPNELLPK